MKKIRTLTQDVLSAADFPGEILTGVPVVELKGQSEVVVISHRGLIGYDPQEVRIASSLGPIRVRGEGLNIFRMNRERIVLHGRAVSVELEDAKC